MRYYAQLGVDSFIGSQLTEFVPAVIIHAKNLSIQISNDAVKDTILSTLLAVEQLC